MSEKPEALRLADALMEDHPFPRDIRDAAAELRRLHELALEQQGKIYALEMARLMEQKTAALKQAALLEALKWYVETDEVDDAPGNEFWLQGRDRARAAIKAVEE